jgi:hypothetical protein
MRSKSPMAIAILAAVVWLYAVPAGAQQVTKENIPGITNLARLETTVACAGATKAEAVPEIKEDGVCLDYQPQSRQRTGS